MEPSQEKNALIDVQRLLMANATLKQKNAMNVREVLMIQLVYTQWTIAKQSRLEENAKENQWKVSIKA